MQCSVHGPPPFGPLPICGEGWLPGSATPGLGSWMWRWGADWGSWLHPGCRAPLSQALWEHADKHVGPGRGLACLGLGRSHREAQGGLESMPACPESASLSLCHRALEDPSLWSGIKQGRSRDAWKHLRTD